MNLYGKYLRRSIDEDGKTEITLSLYSFADTEIARQLEKGELYKIALTKATSKRTNEQNKLMWALIHDIAVARGTKRANDDYDIYIEALERAGAKFDYMQILPPAETLLKEHFRAVKFVNAFEQDGKIWHTYKVYYGSSKMNKEEMNILLETVMDMAEECGVHTVLDI